MVYGHNWRIYKSKYAIPLFVELLKKNMGGRLLGHGRLIGIIRYMELYLMVIIHKKRMFYGVNEWLHL